jgi:probable phosphoglycerate mutase
MISEQDRNEKHAFIGFGRKIRREDEQRRYLGQADVPLTAEGIRQAEHLRQRFEHINISDIFCSDLSRRLQTAKIIGDSAGIPVVPRVDLREKAMGKWEGCTFGDIVRRFPAEFKARGLGIASYASPTERALPTAANG